MATAPLPASITKIHLLPPNALFAGACTVHGDGATQQLARSHAGVDHLALGRDHREPEAFSRLEP